MSYDTVVIGNGGGIGETLARRLARDRVEVLFFDDDDRAVARVAEAGIDARLAHPSAAIALDREDVRDVDVAVVASREDGQNLLVSQHLGLRCAGRIITLVNDPNNVEAFADASVEPVCVSTILASALDARRRVPEHAWGEHHVRSGTLGRRASDELGGLDTLDTPDRTDDVDEHTREDRLRFDGGNRDEGNGEDGRDGPDGSIGRSDGNGPDEREGRDGRR